MSNNQKINKRVALVIGVGDYQHYTPLEYCPPSAQAVFDLLIAPNYGMCDPDRSKLITFPLKKEVLQPNDLIAVLDNNEKLDPYELDKQIVKVIKNLKIGEQLVFFFSGHGSQHLNELYLSLPKSEAGEWDTYYDFSLLVKHLHRQNLKKAIIIIDTCYSGAMFESIKNFQSNWTPKLPSGMAYMSATSKFQGEFDSFLASQNPSLKMTLFSYYFCQAITNGQGIEKKTISLHDVRNHINKKIKEFHQGMQVAQTHIEEGDGELWISLNPSFNKSSTDSTKPRNSNTPSTPKPVINKMTLNNRCDSLKRQLKNATYVLEALEEKSALYSKTDIPNTLLVNLSLKRDDVEQLKQELRNCLEENHD